MKRKHILLLILGLSAVLTMLIMFSAAAAEAEEEARDIREMCKISTSAGRFKATRLTDGKYNTTWESYQERHPHIRIDAPDSERIYGVYICFGERIYPWEIQTMDSGKWITVYESEGIYAHEYVPLDSLESIRIRTSEDRQRILDVSEIHVFSQGIIPDYVQTWQPTLEKADLLVLAAHPDDEILFFGGTIPYYASELGKRVLVVYMTCGTYERRSELLDGLWFAGIRNYPVIGSFWDKYSKKLDTTYKNWDGKAKVDRYLIQLFRTYQPEVVVTHDVKGEYGHGAHQVCADAALRCFTRAAEQDVYPELGEAWQVKKLYLHLYREGSMEMDWDQELKTFDGMTGFQVAKEMYTKHVSQKDMGQKVNGVHVKFVVEPRESDYSCYRFGLAMSTVGEDLEKNDFFENICTESDGAIPDETH